MLKNGFCAIMMMYDSLDRALLYIFYRKMELLKGKQWCYFWTVKSYLIQKRKYLTRDKDNIQIKISSSTIAMSSTRKSIEKVSVHPIQLTTQPPKRLTRSFKLKIQQAIEKGRLEDGLGQLRSGKLDDHWAQCKEGQILFKLKRFEEALSVCKSIMKSEQECKQCTQLFNFLNQKLLANQGFPLLKQTPSKNTFKIDNHQQASDQNDIQAFLQSLKANNCEFKSIQIVQNQAGYRFVKAKQAIEKDSIVILVPKKLMITVELAKESQVGKEMERFAERLRSPKHTLLSLFLLFQEKKGEKSAFYEYIKILPKDLSNFPIFYPQSLVHQLENTFFFDILQRKKQELVKDYETLKANMQFIKTISYEDFLRARMLVCSRIFGINANGNKTDALVPLADMLNHNIPKMTSWCYSDEKSAFIMKNVQRQIEEGEEINDSYGYKCNSRFLLNYGFIQQNNSYNEVGIRIREQIFQISKNVSCRGFQNVIGYYRFIVGRAEFQKKQKEDEKQQYSLPEFRSKENELEVWKQFHKQLQNQLSTYPTTIKMDQKILKQKQLDSNYRNCVQIRLGEKQILQYYIDMAKSMMSLFGGKSGNTMNEQYKPYLCKIFPNKYTLKSSQ